MKKVLLLLLLISCLTVDAYALPPELLASLPDTARELLESADDTDPLSQWQTGIRLLIDRVGLLLTGEVRQGLHSIVTIAVSVILCSIAETVYKGANNTSIPNFIPFAGILTITIATSGNVQTMIGMGQETIEQLNIFSQALLPTLAAAVSASGGLVSAGIRQVATVWFSGVLISLIRNVLLPLTYFYIVAAAADAITPQMRLGFIANVIKKGMTWLLTGSLALFTAYLTISGTAAGAADGFAMSVTRSVISTAVPVVGNIISEASGTVLASAGILRSAIGIGGMLGVLAVCLTPFLTLATQYLLYRLTAFFSDAAGGMLSAYINALGGAFGLVLGMTGACALLLLISISSSVLAVIP